MSYDSGFRIHRNTGLCDLGSNLAFSAIVISMMLQHANVLVRFHGRDYDISHDFESSVKLRDALIQCNILPSTVVVSFNEQILPLSTIINNDVTLLVTTVSSGG